MSEVVGTILFLVFMVVLVGIGGWAGWGFARERLDEDAERVEQQKAQLKEQWDALQRTQRINEAFWQARQALRAEAQRYGWGGDRQQ